MFYAKLRYKSPDAGINLQSVKTKERDVKTKKNGGTTSPFYTCRLPSFNLRRWPDAVADKSNNADLIRYRAVWTHAQRPARVTSVLQMRS